MEEERDWKKIKEKEKEIKKEKHTCCCRVISCCWRLSMRALTAWFSVLCSMGINEERKEKGGGSEW